MPTPTPSASSSCAREKLASAILERANARQFTAPGDVARDKEGYLAGIDGMSYGEDPSEGYVRGRRFLHPRLGFTFTAPDRFTL